MGSRPWKRSLIDHLEDQFSGERLRVERPNGEVIEGMFVGSGTKNRQPQLIINTAPPECPSPSAKHSGVDLDAAWKAHGRDWFSYDQWVPLGRGLKIEGSPAAEFFDINREGTTRA